MNSEETSPRHIAGVVNSGRIILATGRVYLLRQASTPIMLVRATLAPSLGFIGFVVAYHVSGQTRVGGQNVVGFLMTGTLGTWAWTATVWGSGNALNSERYAGTIGAVLASPARIASIVLGYLLGNFAWHLPGIVGCLIVAIVLGPHFHVVSAAAALVCVLTLCASTVCIGMAFGGLFILSRQSNALSNFLQGPIWLLAGFYVPRADLPRWVQLISNAIPLAHAIDAVRATTLSGGSFGTVWRPLAATAATSGMFLLVGLWSLKHTNRAVRRSATLDLL